MNYNLILRKTIMRTLFALLTIAFCIPFAFAEKTYSQALKESNISYSTKGKQITDVFTDLSKKTGFHFFYDESVIEELNAITIDVKNGSIDVILEELAQQTGLHFKKIDNTISVSRNQLVSSVKENNQQQNKRITGTVTDEKGEPIIGANVVEKGTTNGTITDIDGKYTLNDVSGEILTFSYIGYLTQEIPIRNESSISIKLIEDTQKLEEVVVIGYGTAKRRDLTGAIASIKAAKMETEAPRDITDLMRGTAAGLNVGVSTSAKGALTPSVRGITTLTAGSDPTIVLDGIIYYGALSDINVHDVESIDVLKDASSAAVYGSQAANGVIVITTKKGKGKAGGAATVTFNANVGFVQSANQMKVLDGKGYIKYRQDYVTGNATEEYLAQYPHIFTNPLELSGTGISPLDWYNYGQAKPVTSVSDEELTRTWLSRLHFYTPEADNYIAGIETDWADLVIQNGLQQDYTVDISNKTDKVNYHWSLGYVDRDGIVVGDNYNNIRTRLNLDSKITNFFTIGMNTNFAIRDESAQAVPWSAMYKNSPYAANHVDDPNSPYQYYVVGDVSTSNPFYPKKYRDQSKKYYSLHANLYAQIKLPFNIEYQVNFTPYLQWYNEYYHQFAESILESNGGTSRRLHEMRYHWTIDNILRWKKEFDKKHNIELTLLANAEKKQTWSTKASTYNYDPSDVLGYHYLDAGLIPTVASVDDYWTGDALMGRFFYSFQNKYMLTVSARRDGYSAFGANNKRAIFPSVALGYVFTSEKFMEKASNWLNYGKLRFSWGQNGNRAIGQYVALSNMITNNIPYINNTGTVYPSTFLYVNTMSNRNLKWERTESYNLGLDFSLFNDVLSGAIEVYSGTTKDLLVAQSLPSITGFSSVTANLGKLNNKGLEITLNSTPLKNDHFSWSVSSTFSMNRRKIVSLYGNMKKILDTNGNIIGEKEADDPDNGWFIGEDPDRIWDYERLGVWQLGEEKEAEIYGCKPGDFKYKDQNEDGVLNTEDKVFQGYKTPRYYFSLRNDFSFLKNFTASFSLYSYLGHYAAYNNAANYNDGQPYRFSSYDIPHWTKDNPTNDYARIASYNAGTNWVNKSFVRLDNVSISYNIPSAYLQRAYIQKARITFSVRNLAVWSPKWNFWDPENGSLSPRSFSFGINFTL